MMTATRARRLLPYGLIVAGLGLLIFVSAEYGSTYMEQRRLARAWEEENRPDITPVAHKRDGLTRILIPKIKLDAVVVEGTARRQLLAGPGHMTETALPGEPGNNVITGHRDTFFRHIYELNKGDLIELRRNGTVYRYEVTGKRVVNPTDMSVVKPSPDARLTLITCYPTYYIGPAPERLVVFSRLVDGTSAAVAAEKSGH